MKFELPLPPSVNSLIEILWHRREIRRAPSVERWRFKALDVMPRVQVSKGEGIIRADLEFHYAFMFKNGKMRTYDVHNAVKPALDVIAYKGGFNDRRIKQGSWTSVDDPVERVIVTLTEV